VFSGEEKKTYPEGIVVLFLLCCGTGVVSIRDWVENAPIAKSDEFIRTRVKPSNLLYL
jgi:hypothetical protein